MSRRRLLQVRQWVPHSLEKVWGIFSDPKNLESLTPPRYGASVAMKGEFREGTSVVITLKPLGLPASIKWISKIQDLSVSDERAEFVDLQLSGPFAYWRHRHVFEQGDKEFHGKRSGQTVKIESGGTWIVDEIEYEMPYGLMGRIAEQLFARRSLEALFAYRKQRVRELLEERAP